MERMGYDFIKKSGLNFGKEKRALLRLFVPKGKVHNYYHKIRRGLSYVFTPVPSDPKSEEEVYHCNSAATSSWDSDINVSDIFESLSVNMVSSVYLEDDKEDTFKSEELVQSNSDLWIKHLNTLWDIRFEQRESLTEDKVTDKSWR